MAAAASGAVNEVGRPALHQATGAVTAAAQGSSELAGLAARAAEGDEVAFGRLVREVRPQLYRWALVQVGDPDDAEDITQAATLRLQRALGGFRFGSRLSTWLYAVVRSAAADWRRSVRRRAVRQHAYAVAHPLTAPVAERSGHGELLALVREQLGALPARQREIFDLAELQGRPAAEVAEQLGLSDSTVRVHLLRARRAIRARVLARHGALRRPPES